MKITLEKIDRAIPKISFFMGVVMVVIGFANCFFITDINLSATAHVGAREIAHNALFPIMGGAIIVVLSRLWQHIQCDQKIN